MKTYQEAKEELSKITECQHCDSHDILVERKYMGRETSTMGDIPLYTCEAECKDCGMILGYHQVKAS